MGAPKQDSISDDYKAQIDAKVVQHTGQVWLSAPSFTHRPKTH